MSDALTREQLLERAAGTTEWDYIVVGGGATGLGTAVEAASRGYRTLLLEAHDFAKGTSSRSTKLVHGGVRYLKQGDIKLVLEALRERGRMLRNAPHLTHRQAFVVPAYSFLDLPVYGAGLTLYDLLAGREGLGRSRILGRSRAAETLTGIETAVLRGGILYYDGQFDDARFAIALLRTLGDLGGTALNYMPVTQLIKEGGQVRGVRARDEESSKELRASAKVVVNATGVFSDELRRLDDADAAPMLTVSQGTHFVFKRDLLPGSAALMIPKTSDGRVLFAIPWHDRVVVGTTDEAVPKPASEPRALRDEQQYLADSIKRYFGRTIHSDEVLSMWSGQRPLVKKSDATSTAALSRDHTILIAPSRLVTVTGGKWTTYRKMGQDVVDRTSGPAGLPARPSRTAEMRLHGWTASDNQQTWAKSYGADVAQLQALIDEEPSLGEVLHKALPYRKAEIVWAVRQEMARTVEDALARRTRALFLDARASREAARETARLMARELGRDERWEQRQISDFSALAGDYIWNG